MTDRSSCYIRHPNARNCRRRRGNSLDLMLCDGLWKVLCISTWRLFYAFPQTFVERDREQRICTWQARSDASSRTSRTNLAAPVQANACVRLLLVCGWPARAPDGSEVPTIGKHL